MFLMTAWCFEFSHQTALQFHVSWAIVYFVILF